MSKSAILGFGDWWSPVLAEETRRPVPVGERCVQCHEVFGPSDTEYLSGTPTPQIPSIARGIKAASPKGSHHYGSFLT